MLLEQPLDRGHAQPCGFCRCGRPEPKLEKPSGGKIISKLQHLGVIPPELLMEAIAQPNPLLLQLLCKARPRAELDETGVSNLQAPGTDAGRYADRRLKHKRLGDHPWLRQY